MVANLVSNNLYNDCISISKSFGDILADVCPWLPLLFLSVEQLRTCLGGVGVGSFRRFVYEAEIEGFPRLRRLLIHLGQPLRGRGAPRNLAAMPTAGKKSKGGPNGPGTFYIIKASAGTKRPGQANQ